MRPRARSFPLRTALVGAAWGGLGYLVLWGHTPLFPSRRMVTSLAGMVIFLPVRIVLTAIRAVEKLAGRTFALADSSWWIGLLAALAGAAIALLGYLTVVMARRLLTRRERP